MNEQPPGEWDETDIEALLALEPTEPHRFRSRYGDGNLNGRSYGGQLLGQALMAAAQTVPQGRPCASYQFTFLRGANPKQPVDFTVALLQDGQRFSSRHVLAAQNDQIVASANATFSVALAGPEHQTTVEIDSDPETLCDLRAIPDALMNGLRPLGPYSRHVKPSIDFRVPELAQQMSAATAQPRLRYWLRSRAAVSRDERAEAAVFAFLSDWWLNFSSFSGELQNLQSKPPLYIASLNHCIWFHRRFSPGDWMFVDTRSPAANAGRGLSIASVCNRQGQMLATMSQESLMVQPDGAC